MGRVRKIDGYIRSQMLAMASAATRAVAEPLAAWALRRIRSMGGRSASTDTSSYTPSMTTRSSCLPDEGRANRRKRIRDPP